VDVATATFLECDFKKKTQMTVKKIWWLYGCKPNLQKISIMYLVLLNVIWEMYEI